MRGASRSIVTVLAAGSVAIACTFTSSGQGGTPDFFDAGLLPDGAPTFGGNSNGGNSNGANTGNGNGGPNTGTSNGSPGTSSGSGNSGVDAG